MIKVLLMHAFNASTFSFNKALLYTLPPFLLAGLGALGGSIILMGSLWYKGSLKSLISKKLLTSVIPLAVCITYGAGFLRFYALSHVSSFYVAFFSALDPFLTALLCYIMRGQRVTVLQIAGIVLASIGSVPMLLSTTAHGSGGTSSELTFLPLVALFGYLIINRYGWIRMTDITQSHGYSVTQIVCLMTAVGAFFSLATSGILEIPSMDYSGLFSFSLLCMLAYVMVVSTVVCSRSYVSLLKEYSVTFLSLTEFLTPIFVALYGWLFLHEKITWHFFVSIFLVIIGLLVFAVPVMRNKADQLP